MRHARFLYSVLVVCTACTHGFAQESSTSSSAPSLSLAATTRGDATFQRPRVDGSGLSGIGTAVPHYDLPFSWAGGPFQLSAQWREHQDGILFLYRGAFDPQNALLNFFASNDNAPLQGGQRVPNSDLGLNLPAGEYVLVVTGFDNDDFGNFDLLSYTPPPLTTPALGRLFPPAGTLAGTVVEITGEDLSAVTAVEFGGQLATNLSVVHDRLLACVAPAAAAPGSVTVSLITPAGRRDAPNRFDYVAPQPLPVVSGLSHASLDVRGIRKPITISGRQFTGTVGVAIGGNTAHDVVVQSDTEITCWTPGTLDGPNPIEVTTVVGSSNTNHSITFVDVLSRPLLVTRFGETTLGQPRWTRPSDDGSGLSMATAVPFLAQELVVPHGASGGYQLHAAWQGGQLGALHLYHKGFDPARPLDRLYAASEDSQSGTADSFFVQLIEGERYHLVVTGQTNGDMGPFQVEILGAHPMGVPGQQVTTTPNATAPSPSTQFPSSSSSSSSSGCGLTPAAASRGSATIVLLVLALGLARRRGHDSAAVSG